MDKIRTKKRNNTYFFLKTKLITNYRLNIISNFSFAPATASSVKAIVGILKILHIICKILL